MMKRNFAMGFLYGSIVGGIMGGLSGTYFAIRERTFLYFPMFILSSGASFGFVMGIGACIRSHEPKK